MELKSILCAGLAAGAIGGSAVANASVDFLFNWGATSEGFSGAPMSDPVREMKFTTESVVKFNGVPFATGSTFNDYIVLRIDQLFDSLGNPVLSPYGLGSQMEVTILAAFTGVQTNLGGNNYVITGFSDFRMYYDGPNGGFTAASFPALGTFTDGQQVETASFAFGVGENAVNAPDGATDLTVGLLDLLIGNDFEVSPTGAPSPLGYTAVTNSNNHLCVEPLQTCASSTGAILAAFGQTDNPGFTFHSKSDGSIEKVAAIPAPQTLSLVGIGLVIMGFLGRRKRNSGLTQRIHRGLAS